MPNTKVVIVTSTEVICVKIRYHFKICSQLSMM